MTVVINHRKFEEVKITFNLSIVFLSLLCMNNRFSTMKNCSKDIFSPLYHLISFYIKLIKLVSSVFLWVEITISFPHPFHAALFSKVQRI